MVVWYIRQCNRIQNKHQIHREKELINYTFNSKTVNPKKNLAYRQFFNRRTIGAPASGSTANPSQGTRPRRKAVRANPVTTINTFISHTFQYKNNPTSSQELLTKVEKFRKFQARVKQNRSSFRVMKPHIALKRGLLDQDACSYHFWSQGTSRNQIRQVKNDARENLRTQHNSDYCLVYKMNTTHKGKMKDLLKHFYPNSQNSPKTNLSW